MNQMLLMNGAQAQVLFALVSNLVRDQRQKPQEQNSHQHKAQKQNSHRHKAKHPMCLDDPFRKTNLLKAFRIGQTFLSVCLEEQTACHMMASSVRTSFQVELFRTIHTRLLNKGIAKSNHRISIVHPALLSSRKN